MEATELCPDWASWYSKEPWLPGTIYTDPRALEGVVDWFSSDSESHPGKAFMGFAGFSEMALALGMLLREWVLYKQTRMELGPFNTVSWSEIRLGSRFPTGLCCALEVRVEDVMDSLQEYASVWRREITAELELLEELNGLATVGPSVSCSILSKSPHPYSVFLESDCGDRRGCISLTRNGRDTKTADKATSDRGYANLSTFILE